MRSLLPAALLPFAVHLTGPAPAAAQKAFEGVLTGRVLEDGKPTMAMKIMAKGGRARIEMTGDGQTMIMITGDAGKAYMLAPETKQYFVLETAGMAGDAAEKKLQIRKLGRSETVAGRPCEMFQFGRAGDTQYEVCVTRGLGTLGWDLGGTGPSAWASPADLQLIRSTIGEDAFPLRQMEIGKKGYGFEVTKIETQAVAAELMAPPKGWTELKMPGMARPPR